MVTEMTLLAQNEIILRCGTKLKSYLLFLVFLLVWSPCMLNTAACYKLIPVYFTFSVGSSLKSWLH